MNSKLYIIVGVLLIVGVGGYILYKSMASGYSQPTASTGGYTSTSPVAAVPTASSASPASTEAMISVANDPKYGQILVGNNGKTLYMYTKDSAGTVACTGKCLDSWPPLITQGQPVLGSGVNAAMVGTAQLPDGSKIVTYNHQPLYYWIKDTKAGDVAGQEVGGVWYVISPQGQKIEE